MDCVRRTELQKKPQMNQHELIKATRRRSIKNKRQPLEKHVCG